MPNIPHKVPKFKNSKTNSEFTIQQIDNMIDACIAVEHRLTDWEVEFISELFNQFDEDRWISESQLIKLEEIYANKSK